MRQTALYKKPPRQARPSRYGTNKRRRCIVTRREGLTDGMIRFVVGPDRRIIADLAERLPGRGYWLSADKATLEEARTKGAFAKAAGGPVIVDEGLAAEVGEQLSQRALNYLGLTLRAGTIAIGHDQVRADICAKRAALLLQATDGAVQPRARMRTLAHSLPAVEMFTRSELSRALGRDDIVYAVLQPSPLADRFLRECRRLGSFRVGGTIHPKPDTNNERRDQKGIE